MSVTKELVIEALSHVIEPDIKKDIITLGFVSDIVIQDNAVSFTVLVNNPAMHNKKKMEEMCKKALHQSLGDTIEINIHVKPIPPQSNSKELEEKLPDIKNIIAIASGKGGVGKSTITANIAVGLVQEGYKVGIVDADIFGPSIPMMFDVMGAKPKTIKKEGKEYMQPVLSHGVKIISIGFFADPNQAVVWRGPMASNAIKQFFFDVYWEALDYLLVDLPPGTSDIHLTLVQSIPLTGAIIVSTPQAVALADARKGVAMFQLPNVNVPVLGIIENMSYFVPEELPNNKYYIFGKEGAKKLAKEMNIPLLGQIPLVQSIRESGDEGHPYLLQNKTLKANEFLKVTKKVVTLLKNNPNS